ncbi:ATP-binding protein [Arsukibacterium sp.]|uniref:ATP-binding protein n=1 Tax=Arsukibacterium sp. TaxID=1977258 RepID=UPI002FDB25DA
MSNTANTQKKPAEQHYAAELYRLQQADNAPVPPGWRMSAVAVEKFICGDAQLSVERKFVAEPGVVTRIILALCTQRGALLTGEPGTAKSWLSELLSAAISADSTQVIQGGTVSHISQLLYSWNPLLLQQRGPCLAALVTTPLYRAMRDGKVLRFEEISRCPQTLQDAILSILSERMLVVPELPPTESTLYAKAGFNIIASANSVDEGVQRMSAALKRRLSFEHISPIRHIDDEMDVILWETNKLMAANNIELTPDAELIAVLATIFHELRNGQTLDGRSTDRLAGASMSTAEAVSVAHAIYTHAYYYQQTQPDAQLLLHVLLGSALKDHPQDRRRLKHYVETEFAERKGQYWQALYHNRALI